MKRSKTTLQPFFYLVLLSIAVTFCTFNAIQNESNKNYARIRTFMVDPTDTAVIINAMNSSVSALFPGTANSSILSLEITKQHQQEDQADLDDDHVLGVNDGSYGVVGSSSSMLNQTSKEQPPSIAAANQQVPNDDIYRRISNIGRNKEKPRKTNHYISTQYLTHNQTNIINNTKYQCFPWTDEADRWWETHPEWEVASEQSDKLCFTPIQDPNKASFFQSLHSIQYNTTSFNCNRTVTKIMWSSGYGADFSNVADGLAYALQTGKPFQITQKKGEMWHYAAFKEEYRNGREPVCPSADMFCYFLPIGKCNASETPINALLAKPTEKKRHETLLREYATRPKQWLRRHVLEYIAVNASNMLLPDPEEKQEASDEKEQDASDCAVIHIRRTDVVLHQGSSRKYFAVDEYLKELREHNRTHIKNIKNILLFTDDANAIDEAIEFHPEYNWMYLKKKRHRGSEGGWENQVPGDSPEEEMIAMQAIFRLAQQCNVLVHTKSGFSEVIYDSMVATGRPILRLRPDDKDGYRVKHSKHTESEEQLKSLLEERRHRNENLTLSSSVVAKNMTTGEMRGKEV